MNRAYSIFHVKAVDAEKRQITGIATTPEPDRMGDIIEPLGVTFKNPLPLLLYHNSQKPVGWTTFKRPTKDGIEFTATIPTIDEPGTLRDRVEEAWQSVKSGLISGVSIGFRALEESFMPETMSVHYIKTEVVELSLVTIPANASATILSIKELDLAASGRIHSPGVSGLPVVHALKDAKTMKTITEQIAAFEATRQAKAARMNELMTKAAETGVTLDQAQTEEYDGLELEVKSVDAHLVRLRALEKSNLETATKITDVKDAKSASDLRGGTPVVMLAKSNLPKGTGYVRYAMALAAGKGDMFKTIEYAKKFADSTPEVEFMVKNMDLMTKASVYPGTIADATWAGPLAVAQNLTNEFIDLLRPATLVGKIPNLRKVPFNVSVPLQTAGGTYGWVGEGAPKPVTNLQLGTVTLGMAKIAGIIVLTEELVKVSSPSAEAIVRADMIAGIAQYMDTQFTDPAVAAVTNVSPASITNGTTAVTSAGTSSANALTDIKALVNAFTAANLSLSNAVFLMSESNAFALASAQNALAQPMFPGIAQSGGTLFGRPVITSQALGNNVILVDAQGILYADDGGVTLDVSREASIEMSTTPTSPNTTSTILVSMFQQNLVAIRAERFVNWKRARLASVKYVSQSYV